MQFRYLGPFIKWAGGKRKVVHILNSFSPAKIDTYYEPFVGGGTFFFYLAQTRPRFKAILSDSNAELVNAYICVRDHVKELIEVLHIHQSNYYNKPERYFYHVRNCYHANNNVEKAAQLIFLNKTCYNGLYRVNKLGLFNVPHGRYNKPTICNEELLIHTSEILRKTDTEIRCQDYPAITSHCQTGDFVYFDPPYLPITETAHFKEYTKAGFGYDDHVRLAKEFERLNDIGCHVLLSNSLSPRIIDLYSSFDIMTISTSRFINCVASKRNKHQELLISNNNLAMKEMRKAIVQKVRHSNVVSSKRSLHH